MGGSLLGNIIERTPEVESVLPPGGQQVDDILPIAADPGCDSPEDDDERNECVDGIDNDGDGLIDFGADPGCESPQDDDERDGGGAGNRRLPRTGGPLASPLLGLGLLGLAGAAEVLRRRVVSG